MNAGRALRIFILTAGLLTALIAHAAVAAGADDPLKAGTYTAKVKALVCRGCGSFVKQTMEGLKPIESATVNQQASTVEFTVRKDTTIKLSEIQTALKAAADKMGMGADYTLSDLKPKSH